ncbi:ABC transporter permease family protein, partial [Streptomyces griseiscabiei]
MSGGGLRRQLLRMGRAASWTAEAGRIRFFALFAATAVAVLAVCGHLLASASFDGRAERSAARWPQVTETGTGELLWKATVATVTDRQYDVVYIEPRTADAPLPPGLDRWPRPGEAVLSPALMAAHPEVRHEYGEPVGTIAVAGLEAPGEYFVYVRPSAERLDPASMAEVTGFGVTWSPPLGEHLYNFGPGEFRWAYLALFGLPAALFVVIAARVGAAARDRRTAVLTALGASTGARAWFTVGEAVVPVTLGGLLGVLAVAPVLAVDIPLPLVDFVLHRPDARAAFGALAVAALAVPFAVLAAVVLLQPPYRPGRSTRPAVARRRREWTLWLFPIALFGTVQGTGLAPYDLRLPVLATGSVITIALLPGVVGAVVAATGPAMARVGAARGRIGMLISGRRLAAGARPVARLVAAVVIAIGLAAQGQIAISLFTEMSDRVDAMENHLGTSVLRVSTTMDTRSADMTAFERELGSGTGVFAVRQDLHKGRMDLVAPCVVWRGLDLPCPETATELRTARHPGLAQAVELERSVGVRLYAVTGDAGEAVRTTEDPILMVLADDGRELSTAGVHRAANEYLAMATKVTVFAAAGTLGG